MDVNNYSLAQAQAQAQAYVKVYDKISLTTVRGNPRPTEVGVMSPALVLPAPQTSVQTIEMEEILLMTNPPNRSRP